MADNYILPDPSPICAGFPNINVYEIERNLDQAGFKSKYIIIPGDVQKIVVTVEPTEGASVSVYTSIDLVDKVKNDAPGLTWVEWPLGTVFSKAQDGCTKVTAVRIDQILAGKVKSTVRMQ